MEEQCSVHGQSQNVQGITGGNANEEQQVQLGLFHSGVPKGEVHGQEAIQADEEDRPNGGEKANIGQKLEQIAEPELDEVLSGRGQHKGNGEGKQIELITGRTKGQQPGTSAF